ncbi:hypothetical protein [Dyella sp. KULCS107]|jgi:hypothetical protein|uniref:hypothetical protein n=1 Tax=unclassified Dyella TaxID=2634549 RepID=UPI00086D3E88|nr:MAG: hypothetical protein ABT19_05095 [Rhodanobacter sp. SCN 68-63]
MKAPNLLALSAAVLITAAGLASMNHGITRVPVAEINGIHVIDLAPVNVTPTAEELRAAALTAVTNTPALPAPGGLGGRAEADIPLVGSQMAMPYYSFANKLGRISKE